MHWRAADSKDRENASWYADFFCGSGKCGASAQAPGCDYLKSTLSTRASAFACVTSLTQVKGRFDKFDGRIVFDPAHPDEAKVQGSIDVASVNTNVEERTRDKDLRSLRFFDAQKYPRITFASASVSGAGAGKKNGKINGKLTIHGVEKPIVLEVGFLGEGKTRRATCAPASPSAGQSTARISGSPRTRRWRLAAC